MYIFGGILELTKELNEMLIFDFSKSEFQILGGDGNPSDEMYKMNSNHRSKEEADSPTLRRNTLNASKKATIHGDQSPTKVGMSHGLRTQKTTLRKPKAGKSPSKKGDGGEQKDQKESGLASPTSVSMQTSYIIKNADESFDAYHQQMKKRQLGQNMDALGNSMPGSAQLGP